MARKKKKVESPKRYYVLDFNTRDIVLETDDFNEAAYKVDEKLSYAAFARHMED